MSDTYTNDKGATMPAEEIESPKRMTKSNDEFIDTRYEYSDSNGKNLIIENSLPKGGLKCTAPDGTEYVYAVFWTQVTNETDNPFELTLNFPVASFELPSSPGNYFKIVLPSEKMTIDKASLFNYGLTDLETILDKEFHNLSSLQRTINSKESSSFYVITLFKQGVEGTVRSGLNIKNDQFYYRVNNKEISCGKYNIKKLKLKKNFVDPKIK